MAPDRVYLRNFSLHCYYQKILLQKEFNLILQILSKKMLGKYRFHKLLLQPKFYDNAYKFARKS